MQNMLHFSVASNLAIHALACLSQNGADVPQTANHIAKIINVSPSHLSKVLQSLVHKGLIQSARGARGGFYLERDPDDITILEVVQAVEGPVSSGECLFGDKICRGECQLAGLRARVAGLLVEELGTLTLAGFAQPDRAGACTSGNDQRNSGAL